MVKNSQIAPDRTSQLPISEKLVSAGFHALSDPLRIQILELLREQELCVCDLCDRLGVSQSKLSFHLKTLKEAGLVRSRQESRWIYYSLNLAQFLALEEYLAEYRRFSQMLPARPCADVG
ncbi:winged helix-turn-helix transcriptional regulator [Tychonema sp. LEGE 07199]|uniref:ArsR/SmtB family transcription factor n=1 Tax=unclassified Tychonema TaxID=2642144 RepID=UPI0018819C9E|nr:MULTISPECIES: metalloregulator ArsR/SmtB family transcription factor [unclassified Tychonema]MBE9119896.1 winged helix-turn-helix transcriptional regulator [Tychonema sp. LEGE 07199]MBE9130834.1 winged helix-turn-helix transcriptional regulator [Tychonema sp. LEGE 07196]